MLKIGEFSKLSQMTVKALRFYEKEGLLIPAVKVLSIYHKGAYEQISEAYAFIIKYEEENGYKVAGLSRESYIDGIWNKRNVDDWLTEVQMPIE